MIMEFEHWANLYCQQETVINGRHVWLYLVSTSIGNICIVDYEGKTDPMITRKVFTEDYDKAERYFQTICMKKVKGVL